MAKLIDSSVTTQAQQLRNEGLTVEKISEILGISKSSVSRHTIPSDGIVKSKSSTPNNPRDNGVCTVYRPDYRRDIRPSKIITEYTYGGVPFRVDYVNQSIELDVEKIKIDGIYSISDIDDLKQLGEALVGISFFFENCMKNL